MNRPVVVAAALLCGLALAAPAQAFRPSARWLLEQAMARQLDRAVRTLKVESEATLVDAAGDPQPPRAERLFLLAPGSMRREIDLDDGLRIEIKADDRLTTRIPGQPDKTTKAGVDVVTDFLGAGAPLDRGRAADRLLRDLKALGVNTDVVSLSRFDGRVAFLIGSKPWELDKPQVWIDKETLLLVRVVAIGKDREGRPTRTDVRLLGYGSPEGGNWFPKVLETWVNDKLVKRSVTRSVEKNLPLEAGLFDPRK